MAQETIEIGRFAVETAQSIADLKANISALKKEMEGLNIGSEEYQQHLTALQENQAALKNAMHGTTASMEDIAKAAKGLGSSYNALVKQMADLDQQFRATEDAAERAAIGERIKEINQQLKDLDEDRGKFGRNVGDYFNQMSDAMKGVIKDLPSGLGKIKHGLDDTTKSLALMGKQPVLGIIALLAPAINGIVSALKDNETALDAVKRVLKALEPVMQFFQGIIEKIAQGLAQAVDWVLDLAQTSGVSFKQIVGYAAGVGNAILQFILTPVRTTIDAVKGLGSAFKKLFSGDFKGALDAAKSAGNDIADNFKKGFSFKANFELGQQVGENFAAGLKSRKVKKAAEGAAKEVNEVIKSKLISPSDILKRMDAADKRAEQQRKETEALIAGMEQELADELDGIWEEYEAEQWRRLQEEEQRLQARKTLLSAFASAVSSIFDSIADMLEEDNDANEKAAKQAKALRTASAVIDTISGAVAAYNNGVKALPLPPGAGIALGVAQAATVLAAGMAQVKKIQATKVGSGGGDSASIPSLAAPPSYTPAIAQTRSVTGRSEVERLNRMADPARVYILQSDIEAKLAQGRVKVAETSW